MAGHSKFKNIMHRKGAQDRMRAKLFSRLGKEISIAARAGGSEIDSNIRLRSAISSAKSANMPKDNIERAIKRGEGNDTGSNYEEVRYEGYGPFGTAIIIETLTNNKNRTASAIRTIFSKNGGSLVEIGSVSHNFVKLGQIILDKNITKEEELFNFVIDCGIIEFESEKDNFIIYCNFDNYHFLIQKITEKFGNPKLSQIIWRSKLKINVDENNMEKLIQLFSSLEDNEDVQSISSNLQNNGEIMNHKKIRREN